MNIEREATEYMAAKREQFKKDLREAIQVVDFLLNPKDNEHRKKSRDKLLELLGRFLHIQSLSEAHVF